MKHFMSVFDRLGGRVLREEEFTDAREAMSQRFAAEQLHRGNPDVEVVVLGAESAEALRSTHSRYFSDVVTLTRRGATAVRAVRQTSRIAG